MPTERYFQKSSLDVTIDHLPTHCVSDQIYAHMLAKLGLPGTRMSGPMNLPVLFNRLI
jgi:hypothetical protein